MDRLRVAGGRSASPAGVPAVGNDSAYDAGQPVLRHHADGLFGRRVRAGHHAVGGVAAIGSMLPWATVSTGFGAFSKPGTDGDGMFTLLAGVGAAGVAIAALVSGRILTWQRWVIAVCGAVIALVGVNDVVNVAGSSNDFIQISVGMGLWLVMLAGIGLVVAGVQLFRNRS
ncbi:MAG: hypothetical protein ABIM89_05560 [Mycobacteriales bacterium]